jgi:hypothetical protein
MATKQTPRQAAYTYNQAMNYQDSNHTPTLREAQDALLAAKAKTPTQLHYLFTSNIRYAPLHIDNPRKREYFWQWILK